jgi:glycosyltransferase involved in cell wall biosynthesis
MPPAPNVSVVLATHRRASLLDEALRSIATSSLPPAQFEVVVADNAGDPATREVCRRWSDVMHVQYLVETAPGKNAALNTAVQRARGALYVFTDDDVVAERDWLEQLWTAAQRWADHALFGGRILARWPGPVPEYVRDARYLGWCFTVLDRSTESGPDPGLVPFGPNMAVRRSVFERGYRFDPGVGPRMGGYIMGGETSFGRRLVRDGYVPVYVNNATVWHTVRPDQLAPAWLRRRAFRYGRLLGMRESEETASSRTAPAWLHVRALAGRTVAAATAWVRGDVGERFHATMALSTTLGALYQVLRWRPSPTMPTPDGSLPTDVERVGARR